MSLKTLERLGRRALEAPLRRFLISGGPGGSPPPPSPERILVVRIDNRLGNLVMLTSLLNALRERFPEAGLWVLTGGVFHRILEGQGWKVLPVQKKAMARRPWRLSGLVRQLRSMDFDAVIDASHPHGFSLSSAVITALTRCRDRIGSPLGAPPGWYTSSPAIMPGKGVHESRAIHALGGVWREWPEWRPPMLSLPREPRERTVGIHPGGKGEKAVPHELLQRVVEACAPRCPVEVFWGSPSEKRTAELLAASGGVMTPGMDLQGFACRVSGLAAFVCPDSGPMHVASAMGVPVVGIFRKENRCRFGPLSPGSVALHRPEPGEVVSRVLELLG